MRSGMIVLLCVLCVLAGCSGYSIEDDTVFYNSGKHGPVAIEGADAASFRKINREYGRDRSRVYLWGRPVADADPDTFKPYARTHYARDRAQVYFQWRAIDGADLASFRLLGRHGVDRRRAYSGGTAREVCDIATLDLDAHRWPMDAACVYSPYNLVRVDDADRASFRALSSAHAVDRVRGYSLLSPIGEPAAHEDRLRRVEVCDPQSLALEQDWITDRLCVYSDRFHRIDGIERASFRVIDRHFAADARHVFDTDGARVDVDPTTARPHPGCAGCIRDANACYRGRLRIDCDTRQLLPETPLPGAAAPASAQP